MKLDSRGRKEPGPCPALVRMGAGNMEALGQLLATFGVSGVRVKSERVGDGYEHSTRFDRAPAIPGRPAEVDAVAHIIARAAGDILRVCGVESLELNMDKTDMQRLEAYYKDVGNALDGPPAPSDEDAG